MPVAATGGWPAPLQVPRRESPRTATSSTNSRSRAFPRATNPESVRAAEAATTVCDHEKEPGVSTPPRSSIDSTTVSGCGAATRTSQLPATSGRPCA
jgi:hypothetical protein